MIFQVSARERVLLRRKETIKFTEHLLCVQERAGKFYEILTSYAQCEEKLRNYDSRLCAEMDWPTGYDRAAANQAKLQKEPLHGESLPEPKFVPPPVPSALLQQPASLRPASLTTSEPGAAVASQTPPTEKQTMPTPAVQAEMSQIDQLNSKSGVGTVLDEKAIDSAIAQAVQEAA